MKRCMNWLGTAFLIAFVSYHLIVTGSLLLGIIGLIAPIGH